MVKDSPFCAIIISKRIQREIGDSKSVAIQAKYVICFKETIMNLIKTIIVEDDREQADVTKAMLERFSKESGEFLFDVSWFDSPMDFLESYRFDADIIFLDIKMPGINGMDVAREIRKNDSDVTLVFITSLAQYAIEGYSVQAEDYVLKPLSYPEFKIKMLRAMSVINIRSGRSILFKNNNVVVKVSLDNITYIETNLHQLIYHVNDGSLYYRHESMKECEEFLKGTDFLRINSSYLVNLRYAKKIEKGDLVLYDGTCLKISRPRMNDVNARFLEYLK